MSDEVRLSLAPEMGNSSVIRERSRRAPVSEGSVGIEIGSVEWILSAESAESAESAYERR